jgi:hypothetical protein
MSISLKDVSYIQVFDDLLPENNKDLYYYNIYNIDV